VWLGDIARPFGPWIKPFRECRHLRAGCSAAPVRWFGHHGVRFVPGALVDDLGVLAGIGDALVHRLAEVDPVCEHLVDRAFGPSLAPACPIGALTPLGHLAGGV
jgi:hypothetical protein